MQIDSCSWTQSTFPANLANCSSLSTCCCCCSSSASDPLCWLFHWTLNLGPGPAVVYWLSFVAHRASWRHLQRATGNVQPASQQPATSNVQQLKANNKSNCGSCHSNRHVCGPQSFVSAETLFGLATVRIRNMCRPLFGQTLRAACA